nr:DNA helicase [Anaerolineae bacterium]
CFYNRVPDYWKAEQKLNYLKPQITSENRHPVLNNFNWDLLTPDHRFVWRKIENIDSFTSLIPIASKSTKSAKGQDVETIFKTYSIGLNTGRDSWVCNFDRELLTSKVNEMIEVYNAEIDRWRRAKRPTNIDEFVLNDDKKIKWSSRLKETFVREIYAEFDDAKIRFSVYRPFNKRYVYFDDILVHRRGVFPRIFPVIDTEQENRVICLTALGSEKPFMILITNHLSDLHLVGAGSSSQCFPFYTYDEDGSNRRENITDWALKQFQTHYNDSTITKWDIFYYVYGMLHHTAYREKYADNLKRDLPRIPYLSDFRSVSVIGSQLAQLHLNYESIAPYDLQYVWKPDRPVSYRVEKLKLSKDRDAITVNDSLTLRGIPSAAFDYRLGNRSALEWIIDQYQVKKDDRSGIVSDPNQYSDDPQYIVKLIGRVTQVSLETMRLIAQLPEL